MRNVKSDNLSGTACQSTSSRRSWGKAVRPWLPPVILPFFFAASLFFVSFRPLLRQFQFNRTIASMHAFIPSILIPLVGVAFSILLSSPNYGASQSRPARVIPLLLLVGELLVFIFILNNVLVSNFSSLQMTDPDTGEVRLYFGSVTGEYASGQGRTFDTDGHLIYYGGFRNSSYDGYGEKYEPVNTMLSDEPSKSYLCVYEGEYAEGLASGWGRKYIYDREYTFQKEPGESPHLRYEGEFLKGKYCGTGTLYGVDSKYQGGFFDGEFYGYGNRWYWDAGDAVTYHLEGCYYNGKLNGKGTKYYPNGNVLYTGNTKDGLADGEGKTYFESGAIRYEGGYLKDQFDGKGVLYWESGKVRYDGGWSNGYQTGSGVSYRQDGTKIYEGGWAEGKYSGTGVSYYSDGVTVCYDGSWSENSRNGTGRWYHEAGQLYFEGNFKDGKMEGCGTLYDKDGTRIYEGELSNGTYNGKGISFWPNQNARYDGQWQDGLQSGEGREYSEDGELLHEGTFFKGEFVS